MNFGSPHGLIKVNAYLVKSSNTCVKNELLNALILINWKFKILKKFANVLKKIGLVIMAMKEILIISAFQLWKNLLPTLMPSLMTLHLIANNTIMLVKDIKKYQAIIVREVLNFSLSEKNALLKNLMHRGKKSQ